MILAFEVAFLMSFRILSNKDIATVQKKKKVIDILHSSK